MISVILCIELLQVQYIDLREIVRVVKNDIIVTSVHPKLSTFFVVRHVLSGKMSPKWRLNMGPFPLNRGVPSIEVATQHHITYKLEDQYSSI